MTRRRFAALAVIVVSFAYALSALLAVPGFMAAGDSLYHFDVSRKIWAGDLAPDPSRGEEWRMFHGDRPCRAYPRLHA